MNGKLEEKIRNLENRILADHRHDTKLFAALDEAQRELGILADGRPFCPFLRPHFFTREKYAEITHAAEILAEAFEALTLAALENEELLAEFDLTEREREMALVDPKYKGVCNSSRFDTFISSDDFKFLEYNAETPAGIIDQMQIEKVLEMIPEVREFLAENPHWRPKPHEKLLGALVGAYRDFGGEKEKPNIAIVDWEGVSTFSEFEVLRDYFQSEGHEAAIADPRSLEYDGETLRAGDFEIDVFYKRVLIHEFQEHFGPENPLARAYRDGNICMANSYRSKIPHKKVSLAIIQDEKNRRLFSSEQLEMIRRHIPWTRKVREEKTVFEGETVDLLEFLRREREGFLLKPNDDYGGSGIVLGWEASEAEWETALENALTESFVAQQRAPVDKVRFPIYDKEASMTELLIDFDPFLFRGKAEGGLVRLSSSSLVNVAQGGGETALVVLEDV